MRTRRAAFDLFGRARGRMIRVTSQATRRHRYREQQRELQHGHRERARCEATAEGLHHFIKGSGAIVAQGYDARKPLRSP
jgi:hypothetical protein